MSVLGSAICQGQPKLLSLPIANKGKRSEIIKTWTELKDHPEAQDMSSTVGSAFDKEDLDEEMRAVYDVLDDGGFIYASFEHTFWIKVKKQGKLVRVM